MKAPFPAFWIRSHGAPSHRVTVEPVEVLAVYRTQQNSEVRTAHGTTYVSNTDLASTLDKAGDEIRRRLQLHFTPAASANAAADNPALAGAGCAAGTPSR